MHFLHTIEENDESEELLQEPEGGGQKESDEPSKHGIRKSRHETDSESYEATMAYSEKEPVSHGRRADGDPSTGLPSVAVKDRRKPHDEPSKSLSPSRRRNSRRSSSSTHTMSERRSSSAARSPNRRISSTLQSFRRMSSSTPGSTWRRSSSAWSSPSSSARREVLRSRSPARMSGPVVGKRDAQKTTSTKRTGEKAPSCARRRRRRTHPAPAHDDLPAPQWLIDLMFDIEEASKHELTVE
ncbi:serine/arginine repetitive matrix protein 2 [Ictalurus punctatus]|uniref:Serine/arginine repetitive matrix protein 2 n=1 Tax=Ictalurus punctatus TaxID=7998 RepID=A0A2D0RDE9_ICTPU|nr:serine/arginine repetitive matrix protein 2 [Ictalurus punctatus]XP_017328152.1 serine/arginine repetitive matrix protein 2 [Ictalurus punctatus]